MLLIGSILKIHTETMAEWLTPACSIPGLRASLCGDSSSPHVCRFNSGFSNSPQKHADTKVTRLFLPTCESVNYFVVVLTKVTFSVSQRAAHRLQDPLFTSNFL